MRKLLYALALTAALYAPAYAQEGQPVRCYSVEEMHEQAAKIGVELVADMQGEELKRFNDAYEARFNQQAPDVDRVLIFTTTDNPEHYWVLPFKDGCIIAKPVRMAKQIFEILHGQSL